MFTRTRFHSITSCNHESLYISPSVVFREHIDGDCAVAPRQYDTDSESDDDSEVDVSTAAAAPVDPPPVEDDLPSVHSEGSDGSGTDIEGLQVAEM